MEQQLVVISKLPEEIREQIPYSIRSLRDKYLLEELPSSIQYLVKDYLTVKNKIQYGTVFDLTPSVSKYGDFTTISTVTDVVLEYLKNYLYILLLDYPFDPLFGSRLKNYLHTRDTSFRQTLITNEINNIISALSSDLNVSIDVENITIDDINRLSYSEYFIKIELKISEETATVNLEL